MLLGIKGLYYKAYIPIKTLPDLSKKDLKNENRDLLKLIKMDITVIASKPFIDFLLSICIYKPWGYPGPG